MKPFIVAIVGLSGVGKSTLLKGIVEQVPFQHLQASALIKQAREELSKASISTDQLRQANIDDNQALLIQGFAHAIDQTARVVVLDGHTIIDTPTGLVRIEPDVFRQIDVQQFVFLAAPPATIHSRRSSDASRKRPVRTEEELREHQHQALLSAFESAQALDVPLTVVTPDKIALLVQLFKRLRT